MRAYLRRNSYGAPLEPYSQNLSSRPRPYDGWALDKAVRLDRALPGFLARSFASSSLKRQAHFAAFAALTQDDPTDIAERLQRVAPPHIVVTSSDPLAQIAEYVLALRARPILEAVYGSCPKGLIGIMSRLGDYPISLDPGLYRRVWNLFSDPQHRERAKLLMESEGLIPTRRIEVMSHLDGVLLRRAVLDRVGNPGEVFSFREAVRLIQALVPDATDERLAQSPDALGPDHGGRHSQTQGLATWVLGWLEEMQFAPVSGPFEADDSEFRLLIGKSLVEGGRRYKNCLKQNLGYVAVGRKLFYEWTGEPGAVVEVNCFSDGRGETFYSTGQIRGVGNAKPSIAVLNAIRARLSQRGVLFSGAFTRQRASLNGLLNIYDDEEPGDTYVGILDDLVELPEPIVTRTA